MMKFEKAMLSQPMAGKTNEEIVATREKAIAELKKRGYEIVNTVFDDEWYRREKMEERGVENIPLYLLAKRIENMSLCDAVYFCKGWKMDERCWLDRKAADECRLKAIDDEDPLSCEFSFGSAISMMKAGESVKRDGWNGKKQYIQLATGISYKNNRGNIVKAEHGKSINKVIAFVDESGVQLGWVPSQEDMLAKDWMLA